MNKDSKPTPRLNEFLSVLVIQGAFGQEKQ
jgi:hypothetical protein